jgi:hypothetical protein
MIGSQEQLCPCASVNSPLDIRAAPRTLYRWWTHMLCSSRIVNVMLFQTVLAVIGEGVTMRHESPFYKRRTSAADWGVFGSYFSRMLIQTCGQRCFQICVTQSNMFMEMAVVYVVHNVYNIDTRHSHQMKDELWKLDTHKNCGNCYNRSSQGESGAIYKLWIVIQQLVYGIFVDVL